MAQGAGVGQSLAGGSTCCSSRWTRPPRPKRTCVTVISRSMNGDSTWQSKARTTRGSIAGRRHLAPAQHGVTPLLFVRERADDRPGVTMGFRYLGPVEPDGDAGERPITIEWRLKYAMPHAVLEGGRVASSFGTDAFPATVPISPESRGDREAPKRAGSFGSPCRRGSFLTRSARPRRSDGSDRLRSGSHRPSSGASGGVPSAPRRRSARSPVHGRRSRSSRPRPRRWR